MIIFVHVYELSGQSQHYFCNSEIPVSRQCRPCLMRFYVASDPGLHCLHEFFKRVSNLEDWFLCVIDSKKSSRISDVVASPRTLSLYKDKNSCVDNFVFTAW